MSEVCTMHRASIRHIAGSMGCTADFAIVMYLNIILVLLLCNLSYYIGIVDGFRDAHVRQGSQLLT